MKLNRTFRIPLVVVAIFGTCLPVLGEYIVGNMSFGNGGVEFLDKDGNAITISSDEIITGLRFLDGPPTTSVNYYGTDGTYTSAIGSEVNFSLNPYYFMSDSGVLWNAGDFEFNVTSASGSELGNTYTLIGTGVVSADQYQDTPGVWILTTQGKTSQVSWSSSISSVPDSGNSALILGFSLLGVSWLRRKVLRS